MYSAAHRLPPDEAFLPRPRLQEAEETPESRSERLDRWDVLAARAGDREAFGRLFLRHRDLAAHVAGTCVENEEDILDVVQDSFLKAYRAIARFEGKSSFRTWIYRIVLNTARSLRSRGRTKKRSGRIVSIHAGRRGSPEAETPLEIPDGEPRMGPYALLERKELAMTIQGAIDGLPGEYREAVSLRDLSGLSYEAIACKLKLPLGTVKSKVHRGRLAAQEAIATAL